LKHDHFCDVCLSGVLAATLPEMSWLHHFAAAGYAGSFAAAAHDLGVHRQTISLSVNRLEDFVGEQLFERANGRGGYNTLTTVGRLIMPTASRIVSLGAVIRKPG
jgi:molybdate transport repressor ModE-like protein